MHKILLKGRGIEHSYQEGKIRTPVLKGVDLDIEASRMTAIVGKSGSGKSTLLHILGTLDTPNKGEIFFQDVNILQLSPKEKAKFRNRHLGFVYQFHHLLGDFTALENVMLPLLIDKMEYSLAYERANHLLESVGMAQLMDHLPSELSGGERQRVAIARALVHSPELILADEPTGNLDENNAKVVFDLFRNLVRDEGTAVVMVTHDLSLAKQCDQVLEIVNGTIVDQEHRHRGFSSEEQERELMRAAAQAAIGDSQAAATAAQIAAQAASAQMAAHAAAADAADAADESSARVRR